MNKIINIFLAWLYRYNFLPVSKKRRALSKERLSVCNGCDDAKVSQILKIVDEEAIFVNTIYCGVCKCPCKQKSLIKRERCPLDKWKK